MYLNVLFCPTNSPNPKDIQFTITYDKEKHQILIFEKLETANVYIIKIYFNAIMKVVADLIFCWFTYCCSSAWQQSEIKLYICTFNMHNCQELSDPTMFND